MASTSSEADEFEIIEAQEASLDPEELAKVQAWLQPTDYNAASSEHKRHLLSVAPETGLWISQTEQYRQWYNSGSHGSLWIKGPPGGGKSVIAASLIGHLQESHKSPVLFFFFRYIIATNRTSRSLIQDWLCQLLPNSIKLQADLKSRMNGELADISDDQLWGLLLTGLSGINRAFCVVDALDEMEPYQCNPFLDRLNRLATFRPGSVKVFMTSRPKQYLQSRLRDASIVSINLEKELVGEDILRFVTYRLAMILPLNGEDETRTAVANEICARSRGLFLYARLILDQITSVQESSTLQDTRQLISTIPAGLEEIYDSSLMSQAKVLGINFEIQMFMLECVTCAARPLRLNELSRVLEFAFPTIAFAGGYKSLARIACAPLLEISEDETVQVIHHSFTEFLLDFERKSISNSRRFPILSASEAHKKLACICLRYLMSGILGTEDAEAGDAGFKKPKSLSVDDDDDDDNDTDATVLNPVNQFNYQEARLKHHFLDYAVRNWTYHASHYNFHDQEFHSVLNRFLDPRRDDFCRWLDLEWGRNFIRNRPQRRGDQRRGNARQEHWRMARSLHIGCFAGLTSYVGTLLTEQNVNELDSDGRTPLHWASRAGHDHIVLFLLQRGAKPDLDDYRGLKPLHEAAKKGHSQVVKQLMAAGVNPQTPKTREDHSGYLMGGERTTKGETAVQYVCEQGHTAAIMEMLPYMDQDTINETMCELCRYGKSEAVEAMLGHSKVLPNAQYRGATPLYLACCAGNLDCTRLLLLKGADPTLISNWHPRRVWNGGGNGGRGPQTPLQGLIQYAWSEQNHSACQSIMHLLLGAGADLAAKDDKGSTVLFLCFRERYTPIPSAIAAILEAGGNPSTVDKEGDTVLHKSLTYHRDLSILHTLLEYGADINAKGHGGTTPLHCALRSDYSRVPSATTDEIVNFLLDKGAKTDVKDERGRTPLEAAAASRECSYDLYKRLLFQCTDDEVPRRLLFQASGSGTNMDKTRFIQDLQSIGVDLESRDSEGRTPLLVAASNSQAEVLKALLECGARMDAVDSMGRGPLHLIFLRDRYFINKVQYFVDNGLDIQAKDHAGNSILHEAVKHYKGTEQQVQDIRQLVKLGIPLSSQNKKGLTPLHIHIEEERNQLNRHEGIRVPLLSLFLEMAASPQGTLPEFLDKKDKEGLTPLHIASMHSEDHVASLLDSGANASVLTNDRRSALHLASRARRSNTVGLLLRRTESSLIQISDGRGRTALHDACTSGRPESVHYLLRAGADVNARDKSGKTPLHACAEFPAEQCLWLRPKHDRYRPWSSMILNHQPWYASEYESTPGYSVHFTAGVRGMVASLVESGADRAALDMFQNSPLDLAIANECQEMIEVLWKMRLPNTATDKARSQEAKMQAEVDFILRKGSLQNIAEVAQRPRHYLKHLLAEDVRILVHHWETMDIECLVSKQPSDTERRQSSHPFVTLSNAVASNGIINLLEPLTERFRLFDDYDWCTRFTKKFQYPYSTAKGPQPPLLSACERELSNMPFIKLLIETYVVNINIHMLIQSPKGDDLVPGPTALHVLASAKYWWQADAVEYLVGRGAEVDARNEKGETPLHVASARTPHEQSFGNNENTSCWKLDAVKVLLRLGADINALDNDGLTPLHKAASSPQVIHTLLEAGADMSVGKVSPLLSAVQDQNSDAARSLLEHGADANSIDDKKVCRIHHRVKDQTRFALLLCAFCQGFNQWQPKNSVPTVKLLLEHGADLYAPLNESQTLIHYVFENADYKIVKAFLDCAHFINLEAKDQQGRTIFLAACEWIETLPGYKHQHWDPKVPGPIIELLDLGANGTAVDYKGRHALHLILDNPNLEQDTILQFLKREESKSLLKVSDNAGFTPLHHALRLLRPVVCEAMIAIGADLLEPDPNGDTALHHISAQCLKLRRHVSCSTGSVELGTGYMDGCKRLWQRYLDLGGDVNACNNRKESPLLTYLASPERDDYRPQPGVNCHVDHFDFFFEAADPHLRNVDGETALHVIARREKTYFTKPEHEAGLFQFIMGKGLDPLAEDNSSRSALDVAVACEKSSIVELFQYRAST